MILHVFETFYEQFQIWLAETGPKPAANDNPGPSNPYEGWCL